MSKEREKRARRVRRGVFERRRKGDEERKKWEEETEGWGGGDFDIVVDIETLFIMLAKSLSRWKA